LLQNLDERKQAKLHELQDPSRINEDILSNVTFFSAIVTMLVFSLLLITLKKIASTHFVRLAKPALPRRLSSARSSVWLIILEQFKIRASHNVYIQISVFGMLRL